MSERVTSFEPQASQTLQINIVNQQQEYWSPTQAVEQMSPFDERAIESKVNSFVHSYFSNVKPSLSPSPVKPYRSSQPQQQPLYQQPIQLLPTQSKKVKQEASLLEQLSRAKTKLTQQTTQHLEEIACLHAQLQTQRSTHQKEIEYLQSKLKMHLDQNAKAQHDQSQEIKHLKQDNVRMLAQVEQALKIHKANQVLQDKCSLLLKQTQNIEKQRDIDTQSAEQEIRRLQLLVSELSLKKTPKPIVEFTPQPVQIVVPQDNFDLQIKLDEQLRINEQLNQQIKSMEQVQQVLQQSQESKQKTNIELGIANKLVQSLQKKLQSYEEMESKLANAIKDLQASLVTQEDLKSQKIQLAKLVEDKDKQIQMLNEQIHRDVLLIDEAQGSEAKQKQEVKKLQQIVEQLTVQLMTSR